MKPTYRTITGRSLSLDQLSPTERGLLAAAYQRYRSSPEWNTFASWWASEWSATGLGMESLAFRICQDLEARLGIAQGRLSPPDYRDYLADLIEERHGSCYRFCQETGIDPGHLSRVLAGRSDLSLRTLQRILDTLGASLSIRPIEDAAVHPSPEEALAGLAEIGDEVRSSP